MISSKSNINNSIVTPTSRRMTTTTTSLLLIITLMLMNLSTASSQEQLSCGLYMAPSSLNSDNSSKLDVGWGLYLGDKDMPAGSIIGGGGGNGNDDDDSDGYFDLYLPIVDKFKTLPYRGQQLFKSWLGYIYPSKLDEFWSTYEDEVYPEIPMQLYGVEEGLNSIKRKALRYTDGNKLINAFSPGIASLVNSDPSRVNIEREYTERVDEFENKDSSMSSYSPYYGVTFTTLTEIQAGTELFIDYGRTWHKRLKYKLRQGSKYQGSMGGAIKRSSSKTIDKKLIEDLENKRNATEIITKMDINKEKARNVERRVAEEEDSEEEEINYYEYFSKNENEELIKEKDDRKYQNPVTNDPLIKSQDWLQFRGYCIDNLIWNKSSLQDIDVGRGAFAKRSISKGSIIAPAPLLAIKRSDLNIYQAKRNTKNQYRYYLDQTKLVGQELLLNYAYGHPNSNLLLVPYTPVVNYINHNRQKPNAIIRWPNIVDGKSVQYQRNPVEWLSKHPLDVENESGQLLMEFIALRDIQEGEEIFIDYGHDWELAYEEYKKKGGEEQQLPFRHEIGVPDGFYPSNWLNAIDKYEIDDSELEQLEPGQITRLKWKHNGQPVSNSAYAVGLPKGMTSKMKEYTDNLGLTDMYRKLLLVDEPYLGDNEWFLFNDTTTKTTTKTHQEWFAYGYKQRAWQFNMHYIAAYNENARRSLLGAMGEAGLDIALDAVGKFLGLDHITCFHSSFMGASKCENSVVHSDVFDTGGKAINIIFPVLLVDKSPPEFDIIGGDANIILPVNYINDVAYFFTDDGGYHKTSPHKFEGHDEIRIMIGSYCSQIDESNWQNVKHLYDLEVVPPFMDQFDLPLQEIHWSKDGTHSLKDLYEPQITTTTSS